MVCAFFVFCGCASKQKTAESKKYMTGVWVSYLEIDNMLGGDFKTEFKTAVNNSKAAGVNDMFVCVRPYCDALYPSGIFPMREGVKNYDFDVLEYMINTCHDSDIRFHAWVNPYRVRTADSEIENLPTDSPAFKWLNDDNVQNDKNVAVENGIYLNPASIEVRALVIDGVREIIENYNVDGIHFDDYFYPTTSEGFDNAYYTEYCNATSTPLPLEDWRRANVNSLISGTYTAIKFKDKNIVFSVSPSASTDKNFNEHYADIDAWIKSGCVDYIIPQLYFGFDYPDPQYRFEKLVSDWIELVRGSEAKLLIGLATYKINTAQEPDQAEWANGTDVINEQVKICKENTAIAGHIYFSYSSMAEYL